MNDLENEINLMLYLVRAALRFENSNVFSRQSNTGPNMARYDITTEEEGPFGPVIFGHEFFIDAIENFRATSTMATSKHFSNLRIF